MKALANTLSRARAGFFAGALMLAVASLALSRFVVAGENTPKATPVTLTVSESDLPRGGNFVTSFAPVVKKVAPSVVTINIATKSKTIPAPESPFGNDEMLRRFFGDQFGGRGGTMRTQRQYGLGSGVIITKDGYILTNNHVVEDADTINVTLSDGREFKAKVVGRDPKTDIAVVKIDAKDLPFLTTTDSDKIEVGDLCLAIGNPFHLGQTVTMGIVSATGRGNVGLGTDYEDFIQTDAAINPGNSGGALVDAEGRLIGINTAILSRSGGNQGIGFAVPVNLARTVMESLIAHGTVIRGFMGVSIQDVNPELAKQFELKNDQGALVGDVTAHSPADKAGLKSGDVIVEFNHKTVTDSRHLKLQVAETAPGTTIPVEVIRDGSKKSFDVTLKELPGSEQIASNKDKNADSSDALNGVTVTDIDPQAKGQLQLPAHLKGAIVTQVEEESAAYEAGLRPGDVVEEINHKSIKNADDAVKLTENLKEKVLLLKIWSKGASHYMVVDESKAG